MLPSAGEVVRTIIVLFRKFGVDNKLAEKIEVYVNTFGPFELPNAIADLTSLTFNNFVGNIGADYISAADKKSLEERARLCGLDVDARDTNVSRRKRDLVDTLKAFDEAKKVVNNPDPDKRVAVLGKLPMWSNVWRWRNLLTIGLICASDISRCNPEANSSLRTIINETENLYA